MQRWFSTMMKRVPAAGTPDSCGDGKRSVTDSAAGQEDVTSGWEYLPEHPVLALLPAGMKRKLLSSVACSEFPKGKVVYREGDSCDAVYLVLSGRCESMPRAVHRRDAMRAVYGPGDTLGGRALLNREPHYSTVKIVTRSQLVRISAAELRALFAKCPQSAMQYARIITGETGAVPAPHNALRVRRVVAILTLAPRVDARAVVRRLAKSLRRLTGQGLLLIHMTPPGPEPSVSLAGWPGAAPGLNGHFGFNQYVRAAEPGFHELHLTVSHDARSAAAVAPFLSHCGRHYEYVLLSIARENENRWNFLRLLQPALFPRQGFLHTGRIIRRLRQSIGETHFSGLVRPLRVIATHLDTLERVVFSAGDVARAVSASIAIPGVAVPVTINGDQLIDGGIGDPLPVRVLHEMGIERVIAVNVIPPPAIMRQWLDGEAAQARLRPRPGPVRRFFADRLNWAAPGNIIHIMFQAISGGQTGVAEAAGRDADVLLRPIACDGSWHDFTHPGKYIALGRAAAEAQLPAILSLTKGGHYEHQTPRLARFPALVTA